MLSVLASKHSQLCKLASSDIQRPTVVASKLTEDGSVCERGLQRGSLPSTLPASPAHGSARRHPGNCFDCYKVELSEQLRIEHPSIHPLLAPPHPSFTSPISHSSQPTNMQITTLIAAAAVTLGAFTVSAAPLGFGGFGGYTGGGFTGGSTSGCGSYSECLWEDGLMTMRLHTLLDVTTSTDSLKLAPHSHHRDSRHWRGPRTFNRFPLDGIIGSIPGSWWRGVRHCIREFPLG